MPRLSLRYPGPSKPGDLLEEVKTSIVLKKKTFMVEHCAYVSHLVAVCNYILPIENPIPIKYILVCVLIKEEKLLGD